MSFQSVINVLIIVPVILLVPGYFTLVAFLSKRQKELDWTLLEVIFTIVAISMFIVSWFALLLAEIGVFSIILVLVGIAVYVMALCVVFGRRFWHNAIHFSFIPRLKPGLELYGVALIALLAALLFVQPFDNIIGGLDSGTYANTGINIAQTGSIIVHDPVIKGLSEPEASLFFGGVHKPWVFGSRVVGFYLVDLVSGAVQPQGFHLFPVWIAILYSLGGVKIGLLATPLFGILGVLGLYFLGKRLFNSHVGLLASFFLAVSVGQIWFSRVPLSEIAVQFFILTGIYLFTLTVDYESRFFAVLAGLSLGMTHLTKIELILLPFSVIGFVWFAWAARKSRREYLYLLGGYLVMVAHAVLHAIFVANVYSLEVINNTWLPMVNSFVPGSVEFIRKAIWGQTAGTGDAIRFAELVVGIIVLALFCWIATRIVVPRLLAAPRMTKDFLRLAFVALVALVAAYAWFVRPIFPRLEPGLSSMQMAVQTNNRESLIRLGWYISPLGVLFGLAGLTKTVIDEVNSKILFFVVTAVPTSVLLLFNSFITPIHFWAGRRFVYIVMPAFLLLAAYALNSLRKSDIIGFRTEVIPISIAIALALTLIRPISPFLTHVEYAGASDQLAELAASFPGKSVVLFEYSLESNMFAVPLKYLYKKDVMVLDKTALSNAHLREVVNRWEGEGHRVYWIAVSKETVSPPADYRLTYLRAKSIRLPEAGGAIDTLPGKPHEFTTTLDIYEIVPNSGEPFDESH